MIQIGRKGDSCYSRATPKGSSGLNATRILNLCTALAQLVAEGAKGPEDCFPMGEEARQRLGKYLSAFKKIDPEADKVY